MKNAILVTASAVTLAMAVPASAQTAGSGIGMGASVEALNRATSLNNSHSLSHDRSSASAASGTGFISNMVASGVDVSRVSFGGEGVSRTQSSGFIGSFDSTTVENTNSGDGVNTTNKTTYSNNQNGYDWWYGGSYNNTQSGSNTSTAFRDPTSSSTTTSAMNGKIALASSDSYSKANYSGEASGSVDSTIAATVLNFAQSSVGLLTERFSEVQSLTFNDSMSKTFNGFNEANWELKF